MVQLRLEGIWVKYPSAKVVKGYNKKNIKKWKKKKMKEKNEHGKERERKKG